MAAVVGTMIAPPNTVSSPREALGISVSAAGFTYELSDLTGQRHVYVRAFDQPTSVDITPPHIGVPGCGDGSLMQPVIIASSVAVPAAGSDSSCQPLQVDVLALDGTPEWSVSIGADDRYLGFTGDGVVVANGPTADNGWDLLLRKPGSSDTLITHLPSGFFVSSLFDDAGGVLRFTPNGGFTEVLRWDKSGGTVDPIDTTPDTVDPWLSFLTADAIGWRGAVDHNTLVWIPRDGDQQTRLSIDPKLSPAGFALNGSVAAWTSEGKSTYRLHLQPADGTGSQTELEPLLSDALVRAIPGGGFLVEGKAAGIGSGILKVSKTGVVKLLQHLPNADALTYGVAITAGRLAIADGSASPGAVTSRLMLDSSGSLATADLQLLATDFWGDDVYVRAILASGSRTAYLGKPTSGKEIVVLDGSRVEWRSQVPASTHIDFLSGEHLLYSNTVATKVVDVTTGQTKTVPNGSVLWGHRIVYPVGSTSLMERDLDQPISGTNPREVATPSCNTLYAIDFVANHVLYECGTTGWQDTVVDLHDGSTVDVPGDAKDRLGDGFVGYQTISGGKLGMAVTDLVEPGHPEYFLGPMYQDDTSLDWWAVDHEGGQTVAWVGDDLKVHVALLDTPASPPKMIDNTVEVGFSPNGDGSNDTWNASFDVSKPVDWTLTVKDGYGKVVRRLSGKAPVGSIRLVWNGKDDGGKRVPGGKLTWTLHANARDGIGSLKSQGDLILVR